MYEEAIQFGESGRLSGVLTLPDDGAVRAWLGLVNSGLIPRSSPYRMYVQMARRLARAGVATLRFDLGGLGDSIPSPHGRLLDRTQAEIGAAVDLMVKRFPAAEPALGGLCSGGEDGFRYAETDERVRHVLLIDPFAYRTQGWAWRHLRLRAWRLSLRTLRLWKASRVTEDSEIIDYRYMEFDESSRILATLMARGAVSHFIYTSGRHELFNHRGQFAKMFPHLDVRAGTTVSWLPAVGHTQLLQHARDELIEAVERQLTTRFGASPTFRPR